MRSQLESPIVTSIDPASVSSESKSLGKGATHVAINFLAWIAVGGVFYLGKPALAPLLFSIVLAMLLSPLVDFWSGITYRARWLRFFRSAFCWRASAARLKLHGIRR